MICLFRRVKTMGLVCVLALGCAAQLQVRAQTLTLRMVDGRTGKPMANKDVTVSFWWDDPKRPEGKQRVHLDLRDVPYYHNVALDKQGVGHIDIPPQATLVEVTEGMHAGRVDDKRIRYSLCNRAGDHFVWVSQFKVKLLLVPLDEIANHGFVAETECTPKAPVGAAPGEYVVLAVPYKCFPLCGLDVP